METPAGRSPISIAQENLMAALPKIKACLDSLVTRDPYIRCTRESEDQKFKVCVIRDRILVGFSRQPVGSGGFFKANPMIVLDRESKEMLGFKAMMTFVKTVSSRTMNTEVKKRHSLLNKAKYLGPAVHTDEEAISYTTRKGKSKTYFVAPLAECVGSQAGRFKLKEWTAYLKMCAQLAESLLAIHRYEEVHGDVKTENCLLVEGTWKFADLSDRKIGTSTLPEQTFEYLPPEHRQFLQKKIGPFPTCPRIERGDSLLFHYYAKSSTAQEACKYIVKPENEIFTFGFLLINLYYSRLREELLEPEPLPPEVLERVVDIIFRMTGIRVSEFPTFRSVVDAIDPSQPATATVDPRLGPSYHDPSLRPSAGDVARDLNILLSESIK